jgi:hypothetical protein
MEILQRGELGAVREGGMFMSAVVLTGGQIDVA